VVNVVICDDNSKDLDSTAKLIEKYMLKNDIEYNRYLFDDYNDRFKSFINKKLPSRIYILDIETPSGSGIDMAREIRRKDLDSIIIFLTVHEELGNLVLKNDLMFLAFINKFDDYENRLNNCLDTSLKLLNQKRMLRFNDRNTVYTINLDDILYFTKDSYERKTIIVTDYTEYKVNNTLTEITGLLDERFKKTHRACIINQNRVSKLDKQNRTIIFDNGEQINLISSKYRRELVWWMFY